MELRPQSLNKRETVWRDEETDLMYRPADTGARAKGRPTAWPQLCGVLDRSRNT